jgi:hypothetical protein
LGNRLKFDYISRVERHSPSYDVLIDSSMSLEVFGTSLEVFARRRNFDVGDGQIIFWPYRLRESLSVRVELSKAFGDDVDDGFQVLVNLSKRR